MDSESFVLSVCKRRPVWDQQLPGLHDRYILDRLWKEISKGKYEEKSELKAWRANNSFPFPYKQYSQSALQQAINDIHTGRFTSVRACAHYHGIPVTTLRYRAKMKPV